MDTFILTDAMLFLSTLSLRRATIVDNIIFVPWEFLSTLSLRRATPGKIRIFNDIFYFYPRSPCGERPIVDNIIFVPWEFLSTLSLRRATTWTRGSRITYVISIHALLAESDHQAWSGNQKPADFYPRSPCGERPRQVKQTYRAKLYFYPRSPCGERLVILRKKSTPSQFLSTLSLRRATVSQIVAIDKWGNFYPRSPCGERRPLIFNVQPRKTISIHALLAESDADRDVDWVRVYVFLSTLSLRRATLTMG